MASASDARARVSSLLPTVFFDPTGATLPTPGQKSDCESAPHDRDDIPWAARRKIRCDAVARQAGLEPAIRWVRAVASLPTLRHQVRMITTLPLSPPTTNAATTPAIRHALASPLAPQSRVEFFRLPASGERDPFFGLSRSWYYKAASIGEIRMIAVRQRGAVRGVRLVVYDSVADYIRRAASEATAAVIAP